MDKQIILIQSTVYFNNSKIPYLIFGAIVGIERSNVVLYYVQKFLIGFHNYILLSRGTFALYMYSNVINTFEYR